MIKNKKAQGLSISAIIIAILALLVLVVLALIFTANFGKWSEEISKIFSGKDCGTLDGVVKKIDEGCDKDTKERYLGFVKGLKEDEICCVKKKEG